MIFTKIPDFCFFENLQALADGGKANWLTLELRHDRSKA
jgi:hypothetical protein